MRIFVIMGKSASGKDTIYQKLLKSNIGLSPAVGYTTRPMRDGEVNGREYYFVSEEELQELEKDEQLIERRDYNTINGIWSYATGVKSFEEDKNYLIITTPKAYEKLLTHFKECLVPIYIETSDDLRLIRTIEREKQSKNPNYKEICRRYLADENDFSDDYLKSLNINEKFSNDQDCLSDVVKFIKLEIYDQIYNSGSVKVVCTKELNINANKKILVNSVWKLLDYSRRISLITNELNQVHYLTDDMFSEHFAFFVEKKVNSKS